VEEIYCTRKGEKGEREHSDVLCAPIREASVMARSAHEMKTVVRRGEMQVVELGSKC
jgi:hypothetical protein